ncbi:MAG TPA: hypothetical protein VF749_16110 [Candidatus Acidoferrum sp.]
MGYSLGTVCVFVALLLFGGVAAAREQPRIFRIRFRTVNGVILLDAVVKGKPAELEQ